MHYTHAFAHILTHLDAPHLEHVSPERAWHILQLVTGRSHAQLIATDYTLSGDEISHLDTLITEHISQHKPLQYIEGTVSFCGLLLEIKPPILIPRPETEEWISTVIERLRTCAPHAPLHILDLCTGSGCIALALAHHLPHAHVTGVDINPDAIALARHNAKRNNISNATFYVSDLFAGAPHNSFDLIISNPPYVTPEEWNDLDQSVTTWEDKQALVASHNGLYFYHAIAAHTSDYLSPHRDRRLPALIFEIGATQQDAVTSILTANGFDDIECLRDSSGHNRCLIAH